jgi:hypothetical protein
MGIDSERGLRGGGDNDPRPPELGSAPPRLAAGLVVGGCRLQSLLGRGGMGAVYRATQLALGREVAVKLVPAIDASAAHVARFKREVRVAAALEHPASIPIYAAGEEDGLLYLVMRLVDGRDLGALIAHEGPLAPARAVDIVGQVAGALDAAHAAGLVHRDVKPANILVESHGPEERAYLSDFGLMRQAVGGTAITRVGEWVGTVDYVAPEQLEARPVDGRADVYALAGVLYAALAGRSPFPRDNPTATAWAHVNCEPPRLGGGEVGERLNAVIARGMAKAPDARYARAGELAAAARAALGASPARPEYPAGERPGGPPPERSGESPTVVRRPDTREQWQRRARRRIVATVLLVCLAGAIAAAVALHSGSSAGGKPPGRISPHSQRLALTDYSFSYPAGWRVLERERPLGGATFFRTEVASPDGTDAVIVDRNPGNTAAPFVSAKGVEASTAAHTPGYRLLSLTETTLAGRAAAIWRFTLPGQGPSARVDVFEQLGDNGYAVLGEGPDLAVIMPIALTAARSLQAR